MIDEKLIEQVVREVILRLEETGALQKSGTAAGEPGSWESAAGEPGSWETEAGGRPAREEILADLTTAQSKGQITLRQVENMEMMRQMKGKTPARIGIGRAGARLRTQTYLTLRADHAVARDAVFRDVDPKLVEELGLFTVQSCCGSRNEHLTRPDLGRQLSEETKGELAQKCKRSPRVQVYISDGLSSQAVEANAEDVLPSLLDGLRGLGIEAGTPFYMRFGRVPTMDVVSEVLDAEVTCVLIGERPGLATANSMSAYIAYRAAVGMPESRRTVVSNIHSGGTPPAEAGAHIAQVIQTILEAKKSGVDLKL